MEILKFRKSSSKQTFRYACASPKVWHKLFRCFSRQTNRYHQSRWRVQNFSWFMTAVCCSGKCCRMCVKLKFPTRKFWEPLSWELWIHRICLFSNKIPSYSSAEAATPSPKEISESNCFATFPIENFVCVQVAARTECEGISESLKRRSGFVPNSNAVP